MFFLIFMNDQATALKTFSQLFAADTCFLISDTSFDGFVRFYNSEVFHVCEWMTSNRLAVKSYKTQAVIVNFSP